MSVSGILGSSFFAGLNSTAVQNKFQQIQKGFQQLSQDLQSGNLSQAQNDFSALQQQRPSQQQIAVTVPGSNTPSSSPADIHRTAAGFLAVYWRKRFLRHQWFQQFRFWP